MDNGALILQLHAKDALPMSRIPQRFSMSPKRLSEGRGSNLVSRLGTA